MTALPPPLPVNEVFDTIQGEAAFTGTPSIFIRLQGCAVGCPWCDTKNTWTLDEFARTDADHVLDKPASGTASWAMVEVAELVARCLRSRPIRHVVITGGEPCDQDLTALTTALIEVGCTVQIETSGTAEVRVHRDTWVTLSPKIGMPGGKPILDQALRVADEIKMPVGRDDDVTRLVTLLDHRTAVLQPDHDTLVWLQPLSLSAKATATAAAACRAHGLWRLSLQGHALAGIR
jgi:7-carboxy-7-deazaguanine synthase